METAKTTAPRFPSPTTVFVPTGGLPIEPFDGESYRTIDEFLRDIRWLYGHLPINMQKFYLVKHLDGMALGVLNSLPTEVQEGPLDTLIYHLRKAFVRFDNTSTSMLLLKLHQCRRKPTQTISNFITELELAARRLFQPQHCRDRTWFESAKAAVLVQNIDEEGLARDLYEVLLNETPQTAFRSMVKKAHDYEEYLKWKALSINDTGYVTRVTTGPTTNKPSRHRRSQRHNSHQGTDKLKRLQANRNRITRKIARIEEDLQRHCAIEQQPYAHQAKHSGSDPDYNRSGSITSTHGHAQTLQSDLIQTLEVDLQRQCLRIRELQEQIHDIEEELFESDFEDDGSVGSSMGDEETPSERAVSKITSTSVTTTAISSTSDALSDQMKQLSTAEIEASWNDFLRKLDHDKALDQTHYRSDPASRMCATQELAIRCIETFSQLEERNLLQAVKEDAARLQAQMIAAQQRHDEQLQLEGLGASARRKKRKQHRQKDLGLAFKKETLGTTLFGGGADYGFTVANTAGAVYRSQIDASERSPPPSSSLGYASHRNNITNNTVSASAHVSSL